MGWLPPVKYTTIVVFSLCNERICEVNVIICDEVLKGSKVVWNLETGLG